MLTSLGGEKMSEKERKRRARKRDGRRCRACGSEENLTVHHILPRAQSGPTGSRNLITLCLHCHQYWHRTERQHYAISFEEWSGPVPADISYELSHFG
ncbi:MAG TPA: HNH endonuclease [Phycisphaerales bacterium]|nr:HNH endonuclease [Phycisphaerales bacterium]